MSHNFEYFKNFLVPTCPPGRGLILNAADECVCPPGHYLDNQGNCVRCPVELGFVLNGGRCLCDSSKGLVPSEDGKACICPPGMELGPGGNIIKKLDFLLKVRVY